MNKKINLTVLIALLFITLPIFAGYGSLKQDNIDKTENPGEFLSKWQLEHSPLETTLILLDLDDTCISAPDDNWLGSSVMFYQLLAHETRRTEKTTEQPINYIYPLMLQVSSLTPVVLTDDQLPQAVSNLIQQGVVVLGLTARGNDFIKFTPHQLEGVGLHFDQRIGDHIFTLENKEPIQVRDGVVFVGNHNTKGEAVTELLKSGKLPYQPSKILLMDDRLEHLNSTQEALQAYQSDIEFIPVLSTYPQKHHQNYQDNVAREKLLHFLYEHHEKSAINSLIQTDPFTNDIISKQCANLPPGSSRIPVCRTLEGIRSKKLEARA